MASHVHILAAESYEGKTTEGVHVCGQRMVDEVRECGECKKMCETMCAFFCMCACLCVCVCVCVRAAYGG